MIDPSLHIFRKHIAWTICWELFFWMVIGILLVFIPSDQFIWKHPTFLWLIPFILPIGIYHYYRKFQLYKRSSSIPHLLRKALYPTYTFPGSWWTFFFFRNAVVFLVLAAAQPSIGKVKTSVMTHSGELVICLDVSNSMNTKDIDPNTSRLDIAKRAMNELLNHLKGERIGVSVFAENAFVQLPITTDYSAAKLFINEIESDMLSNQGTNIGAALSTAITQFSQENTSKTILLVTDGEDHSSNMDSLVLKLEEKDIAISVVGIGSTTGGPVPVDAKRPELGYKKNEKGQLIISKPNPTFIQSLCKKTNGTSLLVRDPYPNLDEVLTEINQKKGRKVGNLQTEIQENYFRIPLMLSLLSWILLLGYSYWIKLRPKK